MQFILKIAIVLALIAPGLCGNTQKLIPFVGDNKKYGYKDDKDKVIIAPIYVWASGFLDSVAIVNLDGKRGYVNSKGKILFPLQYDEADFFYEGLARVKKDGKWGFVDKKGKIKIPFIYDMVLNFEKGYSDITLNDEKYSINHDGNKVSESVVTAARVKKPVAAEKPIEKTEPKTFISSTTVLVAFKSEQEKWGYKDVKGNIMIKPIYHAANKFSEGLASVLLGSKWFFINKNGNQVAALTGDYDFVGEFSEGLVVAVYNSKYGFLDKTGKQAIDFKFDEASDFKNGVASVEMGGVKFKITNEGRRIF